MTRSQREALLRAAAARLDRAERLALEATPPDPSPEILPPTAEEIAEAEAAEARRIARLPWWERMSPKERAERDAIQSRFRVPERADVTDDDLGGNATGVVLCAPLASVVHPEALGLTRLRLAAGRVVRQVDFDATPAGQCVVIEARRIAAQHHLAAAADEHLQELPVIGLGHLVTVGFRGCPRLVQVRRIAIEERALGVLSPDEVDRRHILDEDPTEPLVDGREAIDGPQPLADVPVHPPPGPRPGRGSEALHLPGPALASIDEERNGIVHRVARGRMAVGKGPLVACKRDRLDLPPKPLERVDVPEHSPEVDEAAVDVVHELADALVRRRPEPPVVRVAAEQHGRRRSRARRNGHAAASGR